MGEGLLEALIHGNSEVASLKARRSGLVQEVKGASMEALAHMVRAGMGVAFLPRWPSPGETASAPPHDITFLTLSGAHLVRRVTLVWRANSKRGSDMDLLRQVLRDFQ
jgi:DNA-binding transcriptional LysR family regulator